METSNKKIYTYRYMWLRKDSDNTNIRIVTGLMVEQEEFKQALLSSEDVVSAVCVYISETDVSRIDDYETIKKELKENEEI